MLFRSIQLCRNLYANNNTVVAEIPLNQDKVYLRFDYKEPATASNFFYSLDGFNFLKLGETLITYPVSHRPLYTFNGNKYGLFHFATKALGGFVDVNARTGADPVVVLFKEKYYLFSTWDKPGLRISDDLINWNYVAFPQEVLPLMVSENQTYCAAAAFTDGKWLYFANMLPSKDLNGRMQIMRTQNPVNGPWEKCGDVQQRGDPNLFLDDDGRLYLYSGLRSPIRICELDTKTFTEIPNSNRPVMPATPGIEQMDNGFELGEKELGAEMDTKLFKRKLLSSPCREGSWMTKYQGRYYLQIATPGTTKQWYCDNVLVGDSPAGPFKQADCAPASMKIGGFIGSAGHSGVFQDKHGNWWRMTSMWVGVPGNFTRRLGLFPTGFDQDGRMFTQTTLGDYPQVMPDGARPVDWAKTGNTAQPPNSAGYSLLSYNHAVEASSSALGHEPKLAVDENIRTWWSAQTGDAGEWLQVDLGKPCSVQAVQVNLADEFFHPASGSVEDYHAYTILESLDCVHWNTLVDRSQNQVAAPHDYRSLPAPVTARYIKLVNGHGPQSLKFAVSDLRIFGNAGGEAPTAVKELQCQRHNDDSRFVTVNWKPSGDADGYLLRYGITPEALYQTIQIQGGANGELTFHALMRNQRYYYRLDAFNANGITTGPTAKD